MSTFTALTTRTTPSHSRLAAAAALTALAIGSHSLLAQGLTYDMRMTAQREGAGRAAASQTMMAGHGQFSGGSSRMDMDESLMPGGMMGKGSYVIVKNGTRTEWIVNPEKQQYVEINIDSMANFAAQAQAALGGMVKTETTDVTADVQPLGPGEMIQGYATMKYRLTHGSTSTVSIMGRTTRTTSTTTSDMWVAPQLTGLFNPAAGAGSQAGGNSEAAQKLAAAYSKIGKGVPLKTVSQTQTTGSRASTSTSTMELLNIKRGRIDPSVFEVPAGYAKIDMMEGMAGAMGALSGKGNKRMPRRSSAQPDAGARGQGEMDAAAEDAKKQAKDKVKDLMRGVFGRPPE